MHASSNRAVKIALRTRQVFAKILEMSPDDTIMGGMLKGIEDGWFSSEIADAAFDFQNRLDKGRLNIVGVTKHVEADDEKLEILRISDEIGTQQSARVATVRTNRDEAAHATAIESLVEGAKGDANLVPLIMECVRADATVGEISYAMMDVFGKYTENSVI